MTCVLLTSESPFLPVHSYLFICSASGDLKMEASLVFCHGALSNTTKSTACQCRLALQCERFLGGWLATRASESEARVFYYHVVKRGKQEKQTAYLPPCAPPGTNTFGSGI